MEGGRPNLRILPVALAGAAHLTAAAVARALKSASPAAVGDPVFGAVLGVASGVAMAAMWMAVTMLLDGARFRAWSKILLGLAVLALAAVMAVGDVFNPALM